MNQARTATPGTPGILLLVALVALTGLATIVPAQVIPNPLTIDEIQYKDDTQPFFTNGPDEPDDERTAHDARVIITVANHGNRPSLAYTLTLYWQTRDGEQRNLINGNESEPSSSSSGDPIQQGRFFVHNFDWTPQPEQLGEGALVVEIRETTQFEIVRNDVFIAEHKIALATNPAPLEIGPDQILSLPIQFKNQGNIDEHAYWFILQGHTRLNVWFQDAEANYPQGTSQQILFVEYPFQGTLTDVDDIRIRIQARTESGLSLSLFTPEIDIRNAEIPPPPSMSVDGPPQDVFVNPGGTGTASFVLTNTGPNADTFSFSVPSTVGGWEIGTPTIGGNAVQSVALPSGAKTTVDVTVRPLTGVDRVTTLRLTATARSGITDSGDAVLKLAGAHPLVTHLQFVDAALYKGEDALLSVAYENAGNAILPSSTLTLRVTYADGTIGSRIVDIAPIEAGRSRVQRISVGDALAPGPATLEATLFASSGVEASVANNGFVRLAALRLDNAHPLPGFPGESVRYHTPPHAFKVINEGNIAEVIDLTITGAEMIGQAQRTLEVGQSITVAVTQAIPSSIGDRAYYDVTLTAALRDAPSHIQAGSVRTPVRDSMLPSVAWIKVPATILQYTDAPVFVSATDDTFISTVWVELTPADPGAPGAPAPYTLTLHPGATDWFGLVDVGAPATYQITPFAEDAYGNVGKGEARELKVLAPEDAPIIPDLELTVDVKNITNKGAQIVVRTPESLARVVIDGNETEHTITDGQKSIDLLLAPGNHTVNVTVTRGAETIIRNASIEIPQPEDAPGAWARFTPTIHPIVALAVLFWAALVMRRTK